MINILTPTIKETHTLKNILRNYVLFFLLRVKLSKNGLDINYLWSIFLRCPKITNQIFFKAPKLRVSQFFKGIINVSNFIIKQVY